MTMSRTDRQTQGIVTLLRALPEKQLIDVLTGVGATLDDAVKAAPKDLRRCTVCGLGYVLHTQRWGDDHAWSPNRPREAVIED